MKEEHKNLINELGTCTMSTCNVVEALEDGDCFGLSLDIARSEAAVTDPSKLQIKRVIPTFMQGESFLDSAAYHIGQDNNAHGGFDKKAQGNLAQGAGRETVTGVLPLYLFKEHWQIAQKRAPPIYGLMCTADVMGFAPAQTFTIPFLVLQTCIQNELSDPSEANKRLTRLVLETCVHMVKSNEEFRMKIY